MASQLSLSVRNSDRSCLLSPGQQITVGRTRDNDLQIDDPSVSRHHCTISYEDGVLRVRDRSSANGTYIDERSVTDGTAQAGDVIRLGASLIDVREPGDATQRPLFNETVMVEEDDSRVESIIQRRIEPSNLEWLSSSDMAARGGPELALLERAQRHLAALHRVSERLASAADATRLAEVTLSAVLEVTSADRTALLLRRRSEHPVMSGRIDDTTAQNTPPTDRPDVNESREKRVAGKRRGGKRAAETKGRSAVPGAPATEHDPSQRPVTARVDVSVLPQPPGGAADAPSQASEGRQSSGTDGYEVLAARARASSSERFSVSRTLVSNVIRQGVSVFAHDASHDARFAEGQSVVAQRIRAVMCVPLRTTDDILGALYADSQSGAGKFNEADLELLAAIGNQAGVALHRVRLMRDLENLLLDTIKAIAATIDARDGYTHRHSERVAALTTQLSRELGLPEDARQRAELSALLHDVGKIAVPDSILNKPGKLTPDEYAEMQKHPLHGAQILGNIQSPTIKAVLPGVQYHHERWDGSGYPEGLKAGAIPFLGRLIGVADFYDALTSARAYRPAVTVEAAVKMVRDGAGTHFDPAIAAALVRLHDRGEIGNH